MPCHYPKPAFRSPRCVHPKSGKPVIFFNEDSVKAWPGYETFQVACQHCLGCRLEYSRSWAVRIMHEASLHESNCFITLTFDDDHLDAHGSLRKRDFQLFMKRLRKHLSGAVGQAKRVRYFHCGEYGERYGRPHHHALLFGFDFPDKVFAYEANGHRHYSSDLLSELWPFGVHDIGDVTFESAAYCARYVTKKVTGDDAEQHYGRVDEQGNFYSIQPEYATMSRRPGIAREWIGEFMTDVFPHDFVVIRDGVKVKPPKYYTRQYELHSPDRFAILKAERAEKAKANPHNSPERLKARAIVTSERFKTLKRSYEKQ